MGVNNGYISIIAPVDDGVEVLHPRREEGPVGPGQARRPCLPVAGKVRSTYSPHRPGKRLIRGHHVKLLKE